MTPPGNPDCDVVLRDGTTLRLRPLRPDDGTALHRFLDALSPDSVYFRFFNLRPAQAAIDRLLSADGDDEFALIAEFGGGIVALAQYSADRAGSRPMPKPPFLSPMPCKGEV